MDGRSRVTPATHRGILASAGMLLCATALGGCSGADPAEVTSVAEKYASSDSPLSVPITNRQARCRAEVYLASDLSDGAMTDVREGRQPTPRDDKDAEILRDLADELVDCM